MNVVKLTGLMTALGICWCLNQIVLSAPQRGELLSGGESKPAIIIDAAQTGEPISKYIYGQFIEHLGRCIYGGIWAEMLEDRKFFYPAGEPTSPWKVIGEEDAIKMMRENSYVGEHTPEVRLSGRRGGLFQADLGIESGKEYTGRIVIAGDPGAGPIEVSLIWGPGQADRQKVIIEEIKKDFIKFPLQFTAGGTTDQGGLEIIGTGKGVFQIGTVSLMPADNVKGMRADTLKLLKSLKAPIYRWPGGNFVSGYDWKDGIGDPDRRPPRKKPAWKGIEHNDFGLHEFITFCRELNTEPYITVNTGLGTAELAQEEVEYCNGSGDTPMGKWRAANGHPEPFNVKWWAVGNEMYGKWQLGYMSLEDYIKKHKQVVEALRAVDDTIQTVAVGAVGNWSEQMLTHCADHMELISEHFYCQERKDLLSHVGQIAGSIRRIAGAYRNYRKTIEALRGKDIRIALDEWNYWYGPHVYGELGTRYFLKDALGIAAGLHEYFRNSDIFFMANYAQTVNVIGCIKTNKTSAAFATTGLVLKLYRERFGRIPVEVSGSLEPLDVAAAWTEDRQQLTIGIVNPTKEMIKLPLEVKGATLTGRGFLGRITGSDEMDYNEVGKAPKVWIQERLFIRTSDEIAVPALSATLYSLRVQPVNL